MSRPLITVLGSLNVDFITYVPHHPLPGETLTANHFHTAPGGKGANQAIACAKLSRSPASCATATTSSTSSSDDRGCAHSRSDDGISDSEPPTADVAMIGAVGSDAAGTELRAALASFGVAVDRIAIPADARTGIAVIVIDEPSGQNRIILSPEANSFLRPHHFAELPSPRPNLLVMQLEIPPDTVLQALSAAVAADVPVLLNPAPAQTLPASAYRGLAHLVVNETEAAQLAPCAESDLDDLSGLRLVASRFIEKGVSNAIITLGGRGVFYMTASGENALVPALDVAVVETTAAGDTFIGSYAVAVVTAGAGDFDIHAAVSQANRAAAITVLRKGAQESMPWRHEL